MVRLTIFSAAFAAFIGFAGGCTVSENEDCVTACTEVFEECDAGCEEDDEDCHVVCEDERDVCFTGCDEDAGDDDDDAS